MHAQQNWFFGDTSVFVCVFLLVVENVFSIVFVSLLCEKRGHILIGLKLVGVHHERPLQSTNMACWMHKAPLPSIDLRKGATLCCCHEGMQEDFKDCISPSLISNFDSLSRIFPRIFQGLHISLSLMSNLDSFFQEYFQEYF